MSCLGPLRLSLLGALGPGPAGPLDKTALIVTLSTPVFIHHSCNSLAAPLTLPFSQGLAVFHVREIVI